MGKYVTKGEFVEFKAEMMNAVKAAIAEALAPATKGNGTSGNEGSNAQSHGARGKSGLLWAHIPCFFCFRVFSGFP